MKSFFRKSMLRTTWSVVGLTLSLVCANACYSVEPFDSYGVAGVAGGAIHGEITEDATKRLGINDCDDLQESVRFPDWEQTSVKGLSLRPNNLYKPTNHFDRAAGKSHEQAFSEAAYFVRTEHEKCIKLTKAGDTDASLASLGRVLHALQDLVSHSNFIDLTEAQQKQTVQAVWDESAKAPAELTITGYDTTAKDPGKPAGENYAHDDFCKDNPNKNAEAKRTVNGKTKYKIAYDKAVSLSEQTLRMIQTELGNDWTKLAKKFD